MMKLFTTFFIILISQVAAASFEFKISNNSIDNSINLGRVSLSLCNSPEIDLSNLSDNSTPAVCQNYQTGFSKGIDLIIPVRVTFTESPGQPGMDIYYKAGGIHSFEVFDLKPIRNGVIGGGTSLINGPAVYMKNGDIFLYELEIRAIISPSTNSSFDNYLIIDMVAPE